jgi:hypothetical protein
MKTKIVIAALVVILIYSCSPKIAPQVTEVKEVIGMLTPEMYEGKSMYENNCASCHKLYPTKAFSADEWKPILDNMQKNTKLQDAEIEKIYKYLTSN